MIRVALVEDDQDLLEDITFSLRDEGFKVSPCCDGKALDHALARASFDVVVLDIGLPGEDGLAIARRVHAAMPQIGIVMLTARTDARSRIKGMEDGADAYLGKPTDLRELALVIHALVRRLSLATTHASSELTLLEAEHKLLLPSGLKIDLNAAETQLLSRLARATGHRASRREIIEDLGADFVNYDERRLETIVSRLRRKLETAQLPPDTIQALRGVGYALSARMEVRLGRNTQSMPL